MMQRALTVFIIRRTMEWENKPGAQNKGRAPLGEAVAGLWSYLSRVFREGDFDVEKNSSQTVTYSHGNNCQTCSRAHRLPHRQRSHELLFIPALKTSSDCLRNTYWVLFCVIFFSQRDAFSCCLTLQQSADGQQSVFLDGKWIPFQLGADLWDFSFTSIYWLSLQSSKSLHWD